MAACFLMTHSCIHPCMHSFIHPCMHSSIHPSIHSSIHIHPSTHPSMHSPPGTLGSVGWDPSTGVALLSEIQYPQCQGCRGVRSESQTSHTCYLYGGSPAHTHEHLVKGCGEFNVVLCSSRFSFAILLYGYHQYREPCSLARMQS